MARAITNFVHQIRNTVLWGVRSTGLNFIQPIRVHFNLPKSSVKCSLSLSFVIIKRVQFNGLQLNINEAYNW